MNIDEIKAAATNVLEHHDDYGGHEIALARALLAALKVVEAARDYEHECDNPVPDYVLRRSLRKAVFNALAAFDKAIEGMEP